MLHLLVNIMHDAETAPSLNQWPQALAAAVVLADILRGQGKASDTAAPKQTELLEKRAPDPKTGSSGAKEACSVGQQQQQQHRRLFTAARGFAASAARSVRSVPRAL